MNRPKLFSSFNARVGYLLYGDIPLIYKNTCILVKNGVIEKIYDCTPTGSIWDLPSILVMPAPFNAHIHTGDYAFPEAGINLSLEEVVKFPKGLKHQLLKRVSRKKLVKSIADVLIFSSQIGVGVIADFREGGIEGCRIAREAEELARKELSYMSRYIVLGRPSPGLTDLDELVECVDGIGLSSPIEYSWQDLREIGYAAGKRGVPVFTHVAETSYAREQGDLEKAISMPGLKAIVHGVYLNNEDLKLVKSRGLSIILCPRSNMWWGVGTPPIRRMIERGNTLAIGTDNAAWIPPDPWGEIHATVLLLRQQDPLFTDFQKVFQMLAVNAYSIFELEGGIIEEGRGGPLVLLNTRLMGLERSHNFFASLTKRGGANAVWGMILSERN